MEFELLKDLPYSKKGAIYTKENHTPDYYNTNGGEYRNRLSKDYVENNSEWFERIDNCVFNFKRIRDRIDELNQQKEAFNAARKLNSFDSKKYRTFDDFMSHKFQKAMSEAPIEIYYENSVKKYDKEIWEGIANNLSEFVKAKTPIEEIGKYLKTQFEILGM